MNANALRNLTFGFRAARAVMAGTALGVFDALAAKPLSEEEVARRCGLAPEAAAVLLEALAAIGVLERRGDCFANTAAVACTLETGATASRRHVVLHDRWHWGLWTRLEEALRSGEPVRDRTGDPFLSDPRVLAELLPNLAHAMVETSRGESRRLAQRAPLHGDERLLDLGGGLGNFAAEIVRRHPGVHAWVLDLPPVAEAARRWIAEQGLASRVRVHAADFRRGPLDPEGKGFEVVLLSRILMGLGDVAALTLLERVRTVLRPEGRLLVHEFQCSDTGSSDPVSALLGLDMLLVTGGRVRTPSALLRLLDDAGFEKADVRGLGRRAVLVEATGRERRG